MRLGPDGAPVRSASPSARLRPHPRRAARARMWTGV